MGVQSKNLKRAFLENQILNDLIIDLDLVIDKTESEINTDQKIAEYNQKIKEVVEFVPQKINLNELKREFKRVFESEEHKELVISKETAPIYDLIARYFAKCESFNDTKLTENAPSLDKGLLIIGGVGSGKTSLMNTYHKMARNRMPNKELWFSKNSCLAAILEFEALNDDENQRELFNNKYNNTVKMYFDDFGAESDASRYGKRNLIREILEERYSRKKMTYLTTNLSLAEIKTKYGFRIFDRLQEMFNIIIMNGNSFRK